MNKKELLKAIVVKNERGDDCVKEFLLLVVKVHWFRLFVLTTIACSLACFAALANDPDIDLSKLTAIELILINVMGFMLGWPFAFAFCCSHTKRTLNITGLKIKPIHNES